MNEIDNSKLLFLFNKYTPKEQKNIIRKFEQHYKNQTRSKTKKFIKEHKINFKKCLLCEREVCLQIHHVDYENPYLIVPLCLECHGKQHSKNKVEIKPINLMDYINESTMDKII